MKKKDCQAQIAILLIKECAYSKILLNQSIQLKDHNPEKSQSLANKARISSQQALGIGKVAKHFDLKMDALNITYKLNEVNDVCIKSFKDVGYANPSEMMQTFINEVINQQLEAWCPSYVLGCNIRAWFNDWFDKKYQSKVTYKLVDG